MAIDPSGESHPYSKLQIWLLASRPRTLPAAAATTIVGSAAALAEVQFRFGPALAALLAALLLQVGANLANDVFDFYKGADTHQRLGPLRVTHAGLLSPRQVLAGMWFVFGLAALLGLYLFAVAGWPVLAIGLLSIAAAVAYTGGPFPFAYYGLGDLFVFLFFGGASVAGTYYVQALALSPLALWSVVPMGLLTTAILVVNNLRDIDTDRSAGKRTLAVRLGRRGAQVEYLLCLGGAYLASLSMALAGVASPWVLLSWLSLLLAPGLIRSVLREHGRLLNKALAGTGQLELAYALLFSLGLLL
jgi:1,4-dihydroxy-2-naphthoate octaprenyltransferase